MSSSVDPDVGVRDGDGAPDQQELHFLQGGGEMGVRIREFPWAAHPLGPPEFWPQSLKTSVGLILTSQHPMWIGWGSQMWFLYNDAYVHVLGQAKHGWALGRPAAKVWAEIWDICGPLADKVFSQGQASFVDDVRLFMNRGDFLEETYYSFSYSPIRDESGNVGGLFCPSNDVSAKVIGTRRLKTLSDLSGSALVEKTVSKACATAAATLAKNADDIPFALLYVIESGNAVLKETVRMDQESSALVPPISRINDAAQPWPAGDVLAAGTPNRVPLTDLGAVLPRGSGDQPVREALVLPVLSRVTGDSIGVLVAGMSPAHRLDADYAVFFELVSANVGTAIENARAAEEEKQRADALAALDHAKTVFFSNISHEFRTPLTLLLGPAEDMLAMPDEKTLREMRNSLTVIHRNGLRLQKLVNTLLDFSRIEAGRVHASYLPTDLGAFTAELASTFRSAMDRAGISYQVETASLSQPVFIDREMWEKVVLNLISNAFKYTLAGTVTVTLSERNGLAELSVADTGVGIPEHELPRIFERFHR
ncbi:MAG: hypothetical protein JO108_02545, partial [Acidobacteriaceae bacterium]|nr:hypothetical protein [Acidobacteriaceae bacterium]